MYSIFINDQHQVIVIQGNTTAQDAQIDIPLSDSAWYLSYGANNRFLLLDMHDPAASFPTYEQVVIDLTAWTTGAVPQKGHALPFITTTKQLHIYPSPGSTPMSAGSGLAFFVWYGSGTDVDNAGIYRRTLGSRFVSTARILSQSRRKRG